MATAGDLLGTGLIASLARPGGNVTGSTSMGTDLSGKCLELTKEVVPGASRIAVLWSRSQTDTDQVREIETAARAMKVRIQSQSVKTQNDIETAFGKIVQDRAQALLVVQGNLTLFHRRAICDLSLKNHLPALTEQAA